MTFDPANYHHIKSLGFTHFVKLDQPGDHIILFPFKSEEEAARYLAAYGSPLDFVISEEDQLLELANGVSGLNVELILD